MGTIFARVLEDAGVYKQTEQGQTAFMRFVEQVGILPDEVLSPLHSPIKSSIIVSFEISGGNHERFSF